MFFLVEAPFSFISFHFIKQYENTVLEPTAISEGGKPLPAKKILIKTLHRYRNRKTCFDLDSVIWEKLYPGDFGSFLPAPC